MKLTTKTLALAYVLILSIGTILSLYIPKNEVTASEAIVIPKEAIRLRILANSDSESDQALKRLVRDEVNANITKWVQELTDINEARNMLQAKLPEIKAISEAVVKREGSSQTVNIEFGKVQFPTKLYGQFLYPAGEYEAILITLGEGKGANWWCVLFPPLCFLDFSNGVAVSDGFEENGTVQAQEVTGTEETKVAETTTVEDVVEQEEVVQEEFMVEEKVVEEEPVVQEVPAETTTVKTVETPAEEPVFVADAEEEVEVKFFLKELWLKIF
jgi:stage II sporulation protein R